jgi:hypothetical protein
MASSISGIALANNFGGKIKILVFAPSTFPSVDVTFTVGSTSTASGLYTILGNANYDSNLGAFAIWTDVIDYNQSYVGVITAKLNGEADKIITNYIVQKSSDINNTPQGMAIVMLPCASGAVRLWGSLENRSPYSSGLTSYSQALESRFRLISPEIGSTINPTLVALSSNSLGADASTDYIPSTSVNLAASGIKSVIFDLGIYPAGQTLTFRAIGNSGVSVGDYLEASITTECQITGTDGNGTAIFQGQTSQYSLPDSIPSSGCDTTGIRVSTIPIGSSISAGGIVYYAGDTIPLTDLAFNGTSWSGVSEITTLTTSISTQGATFYWDSVCGNSNLISITRQLFLSQENSVASPILTEFSLCGKECSYQTVLTGTATHDGDVFIMKYPVGVDDVPVAAAAVIGGVWTAKSLNFLSSQSYVAYVTRYDGGVIGTATIDPKASQSCATTCVESGVFKGIVSNTNVGLIRVLALPVTTTSPSIAVGIIENGAFDIKSDQFLEDTEYVLYAINLTQI